MPTTILETVNGPTKLVELPVSRTNLYQRPGSANLPAGLIPFGDPNTVLGMNEDGDALEYKVLSGAGGITITHTPGGILITGGGGGGGGTVTSIAMTVPSIMSVAGSPITTSGTLAVTLTTQSANTVFAGPTSGIAATPTFRALVANDIPALAYVTSVGLQMPGAHFQVFNSPVTSSGTLAVSWLTQNSNYFLRSPTGGGTPVFGTINPDDFTPDAGNAVNYPAMGFYLGASTADETIWEWHDPSTLGTVTSVAMTVPNILSVAGSPITGAGTLAVTLATQSANTVFAGPTTGAAATPTFRALVVADMPTGFGVPGNPDTSVQFNNGGVFDGDNLFTWDDAIKALTVGSTPAIDSRISVNNLTGGYGVKVVGDTTAGVAQRGFLASMTPTDDVLGVGFFSYIQGLTPGVGTAPATIGHWSRISGEFWEAVGVLIDAAPGTTMIDRGFSPVLGYIGLRVNTTSISSSSGLDRHVLSAKFTGGPVIIEHTSTPDGVALEINSTTGALLLPRMTTTQRNALPPQPGLHIFNETVSAEQYYDGFAWRTISIAAGTVTNVTASTPLASSGGATPNITIQVATGAQDGYLSSTDWTTFNNKQAAITFSAGSKLLGRGDSGAGAPEEISLGAGLTMTGTTLSTTSTGISIGDTVTSGTTGSVLFVGAGPVLAQDNANFFWDDTNNRLGIGTASPSYPIHVSYAVAGGSSHAEAITIQNGTTSAGSNGQAVSLRFALKSSTTAGVDAGAILGYWVDATHATATSALMFRTVIAGASNADTLNLAHQTATQASVSLGVQRADAGLALVPNGTGALMAAVPNGGTAGGNARGQFAVDWQMVRSAAAEVASGNYSVVCGGENNKASGTYGSLGGGYSNEITGTYGSLGGGNDNTVSGNYSTAGGGILNLVSGAYATVPGGYGNTASGQSSVATGNYSVASLYGQSAHATGKFSADGDAQKSALVWRCQTTDATPEEMFLDGTSIRSAIGSNRLWTFKILVSALRDDASEGAGYEFTGVIRNDAGATTLVGAVTKAVWEDDATWDADVTADNTNDALIITVTGANAKNINWVASGWLTEVAV